MTDMILRRARGSWLRSRPPGQLAVASLAIGGGALMMLAGARFSLYGGYRLRWGIGLLGFVLLAFASWSALQVGIIYRELAADPLMLARLGPGLVAVVTGALAIF